MAISIGMNSAVRALLAQQQAMDVIAHNVANVNTPGYSRQVVRLAAVAPGDLGVGNGVEMVGIERVRNMFVDFQWRAEAHSAGEYSARASSLRMAELALGEPGDNGLMAAMDGFFNAWRDLANAPEQSAARSAVVQAGETLAFTSRRIARSFTDIRGDADTRVAGAAGEVNALAREVAALNLRIITVRATGDPASDLSDQRDVALDRLSQLSDVRVMHHESGQIDVFVGGRALVQGATANVIETQRNAANHDYVDLVWASDGADVRVASGEIGGLLHQRDVDLPARLADLDTLVAQLIADVNAVHAAGFALDGVTTGTAFFSGTGASDVGVDGALSADLSLLATAALAASPGDGDNATALAALQGTPSLTGGSETYGAYFTGVVTRLGVSVRDAQGVSRAQTLTLSHLEQLRQSVAGVNLDEEMVNMVQFQRGYQAAAQVIQKIDEMLDHLFRMAG
ncbi:MAG: flagellar hook-associated protein FlgK [Chloroflexi bacterium]|nr:flagellar hook-associated protein FlgK [Chloroflexota bacterium]